MKFNYFWKITYLFYNIRRVTLSIGANIFKILNRKRGGWIEAPNPKDCRPLDLWFGGQDFDGLRFRLLFTSMLDVKIILWASFFQVNVIWRRVFLTIISSLIVQKIMFWMPMANYLFLFSKNWIIYFQNTGGELIKMLFWDGLTNRYLCGVRGRIFLVIQCVTAGQFVYHLDKFKCWFHYWRVPKSLYLPSTQLKEFQIDDVRAEWIYIGYSALNETKSELKSIIKSFVKWLSP